MNQNTWRECSLLNSSAICETCEQKDNQPPFQTSVASAQNLALGVPNRRPADALVQILQLDVTYEPIPTKYENSRVVGNRQPYFAVELSFSLPAWWKK